MGGGSDSSLNSDKDNNPYTTEYYTDADKAYGITSITLPSTIESIDLSFFQLFPNAQTIDVAQDNPSYKSYSGMLFNKELTDLLLVLEGMEGAAALPISMATVPACVFSRCLKLSAIEVPIGSAANAHFTSENGILYTFDKQTLVAAPAGLGASATIAPECTHIAKGAFQGNISLQTIVASGNVSSIENTDIPAFSLDTIKSATVQTTNKEAWEKVGFTNFANLATPGTSAGPDIEESGLVYTLLDNYTLSVSFKGESPTQIDIPTQSEIEGATYTVSTIGKSGFANQSNLQKISIPLSVTTIESEAFKNSSSLTSINIPGSVSVIGANAFDGCTSLQEVVLNEGTTTLEESAFSNTAIEKVVLPGSVASVGENAFAGNQSLNTVLVLGNVQNVAASALAETSGVDVYVPMQADEDYAFTPGTPAQNNHIMPYGLQVSDDPIQLEVGEEMALDENSKLEAPGNIEVATSYKSAVSVTDDRTLVAKHLGITPVTTTLLLDDQTLVAATQNVTVVPQQVQSAAESDEETVEANSEGTPLSARATTNSATIASIRLQLHSSLYITLSNSNGMGTAYWTGGSSIETASETWLDVSNYTYTDYNATYLDSAGIKYISASLIDSSTGLGDLDVMSIEELRNKNSFEIENLDVSNISRVTTSSGKLNLVIKCKAFARLYSGTNSVTFNTYSQRMYFDNQTSCAAVVWSPGLITQPSLQRASSATLIMPRYSYYYNSTVEKNNLKAHGNFVRAKSQTQGSLLLSDFEANKPFTLPFSGKDVLAFTADSLDDTYYLTLDTTMGYSGGLDELDLVTNGDWRPAGYYYMYPVVELSWTGNIDANSASNYHIKVNSFSSMDVLHEDMDTSNVDGFRTASGELDVGRDMTDKGSLFEGDFTSSEISEGFENIFSGNTRYISVDVYPYMDVSLITFQFSNNLGYHRIDCGNHIRWTPSTGIDIKNGLDIKFEFKYGDCYDSWEFSGVDPFALGNNLKLASGASVPVKSLFNQDVTFTAQKVDINSIPADYHIVLNVQTPASYYVNYVEDSNGDTNTIWVIPDIHNPKITLTNVQQGDITSSDWSWDSTNKCYVHNGVDKNITVPNVNRAGYTFNYWEFVGTAPSSYASTDFSLKANITVNKYNVTFNSQGGSSVASQNIAYGGLVTKPTDPTRAGYTFGGWYKEQACTNAWNFTTDTVTQATTLYAKWTTNSYAVTFNSQGGSSVASQSVAYGGLVTKPTDPTRAGYTFGGWYKEQACTNAWNFTTDTVTQATTLYAKWTTNSYAVTFDSQGGSSVANQSVAYGGLVTKPTDPTRAGYTFGGWYKEQACTNAWNFTTDTVTQATTLYAKWTTNYTVKFNANGGSPAPSNQSVSPGGKVAQPVTGKTGYTLDGWYTDPNFAANTKWNFSSAVTSDMTLYAKWVGNSTTYKVLHQQEELDGSYTTFKTESLNGTVGSAVSGNSVSVTGFTYDSTISTPSGTIPATGTLTLVLKYTRVTKNALFIVDGDTSQSHVDKNVKFGSKLSKPTDPVLEGMQFTGWADRDGKVWDFNTDTMPAGILLLYAQFVPCTYNVVLHANGGTIVNGNVTSYTYGVGATLPTSSSDIYKTDYIFDGWYADPSFSGSPVTSISTTTTGDKDYYAKWVKDAIPYTVYHHKESLTQDDVYDSADCVIENLNIPEAGTVNAVIKNFVGYEFNADHPNNVLSINAVAGQTNELHVYYKRQTMNVLFNSGTASSVTGISARYGATIQPPSVANPGYSLDGWYTDSLYTTKWDFNTDTVQKSMTLYAKWNADTYTITWDANGGEFAGGAATDTTTATHGGNIAVYPGAPTCSGFIFLGWASTQANQKKVQFPVANATGAATYYAIWVEDATQVVTYTVRAVAGQTVLQTVIENGIVGDTVVVKAPKIVGYELVQGQADSQKLTISATAADNVLTFQYEAAKTIVNLNPQGGTGMNYADVEFTYGQAIPALSGVAPRPQPGYKLAGWFDAANGGNKVYDANGAPATTSPWSGTAATIELFAQWTPISYTLIYQPGTGSTGTAKQVAVQYGQKALFLSLGDTGFTTPAGMVFGGWTDGSNVYQANAAADTLTTQDGSSITLTAVWLDSSTSIKVRWEANGGTFGMSADGSEVYVVTGVVSNKADIVHPAAPTRTNYVFKEWAITTDTSDTVVYTAQWERKWFRVTFEGATPGNNYVGIANSGLSTDDSQQVNNPFIGSDGKVHQWIQYGVSGQQLPAVKDIFNLSGASASELWTDANGGYWYAGTPLAGEPNGDEDFAALYNNGDEITLYAEFHPQITIEIPAAVTMSAKVIAGNVQVSTVGYDGKLQFKSNSAADLVVQSISEVNPSGYDSEGLIDNAKTIFGNTDYQDVQLTINEVNGSGAYTFDLGSRNGVANSGIELLPGEAKSIAFGLTGIKAESLSTSEALKIARLTYTVALKEPSKN